MLLRTFLVVSLRPARKAGKTHQGRCPRLRRCGMMLERASRQRDEPNPKPCQKGLTQIKAARPPRTAPTVEMALRRSLSGLVPRLLSQQAAPSFARSYAVTPGPVGACSGIPEEILERKVSAESGRLRFLLPECSSGKISPLISCSPPTAGRHLPPVAVVHSGSEGGDHVEALLRRGGQVSFSLPSALSLCPTPPEPPSRL